MDSKIHTLVLPGGGSWGLACYGALRESQLAGFWTHRDIKDIYCCSVGSMIAVAVSLQPDWNVLNKLLIEGDWGGAFNINLLAMINIIENCGVFSPDSIQYLLQPLFDNIDTSVNISMQEHFLRTGITLHIQSTLLDPSDQLQSYVISHITHPNCKLLDAVYASAAYPTIFQPLPLCTVKEDRERKEEDLWLVDGGITCDYPIQSALSNSSKEEWKGIMAIKKISFLENNKEKKKNCTTRNIFEFFLLIFIKTLQLAFSRINCACIEKDQIGLEIEIPQKSLFTIYEIIRMKEDIDARRELVQDGVQAWRDLKIEIEKKRKL